MGLFDGYFDPEQFGSGGGLLGRLLALQQQQGQHQPDADLDQTQAVPEAPVPASLPWPNLSGNGLTPSVQQSPASDLHSQYQALRPVLGDRNAMLAAISPEAGQALIAQALANQQPEQAANVVQTGYRLGGIPFAPAPGPPPPIPMPAIPEWWKAAGVLLQLYPEILKGTFGDAAADGRGPVILNHDDETEGPGDKPPSTPIGRRGNPIGVKPGTNQPATIGGRIYTGHAADRMQGQGIPPSAVEEAIQNGQATPGNGPGETLHIGLNGVKVVTGSDGQVITVIPGKR